MALPKHLNSDGVKGYHYLDTALEWAYIRYSDLEAARTKIPIEGAFLFIFHLKCENINGVEFPRASIVKDNLICNGCNKNIPEESHKAASGIWMMEKTIYG